MRAADAILSFLSNSGSGSWNTFRRVIEDATGLEFHSYYAARAFASHALIEFDWLGSLGWSVPPLSVVQISPSSFLVIGVIGDEARAAFESKGLEFESTEARLTDRLYYLRSKILDPRRRGANALDGLGHHVHFEPSKLWTGQVLFGALPQIGSIIDARPASTLQEAVGAGETRFLDSSTLTFAESRTHLDPLFDFEIVRVRSEFAPPAHYYYVDRRGARRIELELALTYTAARRGIAFMRYTDGILAVLRAVPLPILFARALNLSGAFYRGAKIDVHDGLLYDYYEGVSLRDARTLSMKLLTTLPSNDSGVN